MVYAISAVVAAMATFVWALCKVAASADEAARVAWYRRPQPPDEELDELVASVVEEVRGIGGIAPDTRHVNTMRTYRGMSVADGENGGSRPPSGITRSDAPP